MLVGVHAEGKSKWKAIHERSTAYGSFVSLQGNGMRYLRELRLRLLTALLQACIAAAGELVLELLNTSSRVDILQLARIERMASVANVDLQFLAGTSGLERVPTTAADCRVEVFRVNAVFHGFDSCLVDTGRCVQRASPN